MHERANNRRLTSKVTEFVHGMIVTNFCVTYWLLLLLFGRCWANIFDFNFNRGLCVLRTLFLIDWCSLHLLVTAGCVIPCGGWCRGLSFPLVTGQVSPTHMSAWFHPGGLRGCNLWLSLHHWWWFWLLWCDRSRTWTYFFYLWVCGRQRCRRLQW